MKTILIVADDMALVRSLAIPLRQAAYALHIARDAVDAIAQAVRLRPELLILDMALPGGAGFKLAERLRCVATTARTPVLVLGPTRGAGPVARLRELGVLGLLVKPCEPRRLLGAVRAALGEAEPTRDDAPPRPA